MAKGEGNSRVHTVAAARLGIVYELILLYVLLLSADNPSTMCRIESAVFSAMSQWK